MIILVAVGTIYDVLHKKSAKYFPRKYAEGQEQGDTESQRRRGGLDGDQDRRCRRRASGEFCNPQRRIAHLLGMYGFVLFAVATAVMVFCYSTGDVATPAIWPQLWWLGAAMVCVGGYWFWFFIRVDVAAEGSSPFRIMRADLFILSLLGSATFALVWGYLQAKGHDWTMIAFWLHVIFTTVLFGSVPWSKFAHMFFKPAAAFEKRMSAANGSRSNLPAPADKPETFGSVGHQPKHYLDSLIIGLRYQRNRESCPLLFI